MNLYLIVTHPIDIVDDVSECHGFSVEHTHKGRDIVLVTAPTRARAKWYFMQVRNHVGHMEWSDINHCWTIQKGVDIKCICLIRNDHELWKNPAIWERLDKLPRD